MNKHFFVHGKPSEAESSDRRHFDGLEEKLFDEFFSSSKPSDAECMLFEIRRWKGILYSVYTYYRDGRDHANRPNGYCALTLIVEGHYSLRTIHVYDLLANCYEKVIQSTLQWINSSGKYQIGSFKDQTRISELGDYVYSGLNESLFEEIDESVAPKEWTKGPRQVNICDADSMAFWSIIQKDGRVLLSTSYPSVRQKLKDSDGLQQLQKRLNILTQQYETLKLEHEKLQADRSGTSRAPIPDAGNQSLLLSEIRRLQQQIRSLSSDMARECRGQSTKPVEKVLEQGKDFFRKTSVFPWIHVVNFFFLLGISCLMVMNADEKKTENTPPSEAEAEVEQNQQTSEKPAPLTFEQSMIFSDLRIDFGNETVVCDTIRQARALTLQFREGVKVSPHFQLHQPKGDWIVKGAESTKQNDTTYIYNVKKDSLVVEFVYKGTTVLSRREIK